MDRNDDGAAAAAAELIEAAVARLDAAALPAARARLDTLGADGSGSFNFYAERIRRGSLIAAYERRLAEALIADASVPRRAHEIGGGFGTLSWLLAAAGFEVTCLEHDRLRLAGAQALLDAIAADWPELAARVTLSGASFPSKDLSPDGAVLIATNLIYTTAPERSGEMVAAVARYRDAVVDVARFVDPAEDARSRQAVLDRFARAGMAAEPMPDIDRGYHFHRLRGSEMATRALSGPAARYREILERRGVTRIAYFHTDHFEPWQRIEGVDGAEQRERNLANMVHYGERMGALHFARRLGLFYLPELVVRRTNRRNALLALRGDTLGIVQRTPAEDRAARDAFAALDGRTDFDFQVHFHHERLTWNRLSGERGRLATSFAEHDPALDRRRFDTGLAEVLRRVRNDTGRALDRWFFVHGLWALNASDPDVCSITDEIARLQAAGCVGDFTMPAGRPQCDPPFDLPSLVRPVDAAKGYATAAADPILANAGDGEARFLIWSSRVSHADASLDFESEEVRANFANPEPWGERLLVNGFQRGGTLYVKTHAHSLFPFYFDPRSGGTAGQFPHEHDAVKRLIDGFEQAAAAVGGIVDYPGPSDVHAEITLPARGPAELFGYPDAGLTFPRGAIEQAERAAFDVLAERLARLGAEEGGLQQHYRGLVERGRVIQPLEIEVANVVHRLVPPALRVVHPRSAAGALSLALAVGGRRVLSIEGNARRCAAQGAIRDRLAGEVPGLAARFALRCSAPRDLRRDDVAGAFALFTEFSSPLDDGQLARLIEVLGAAEMVLFDALRFGGRRSLHEGAAFATRLQDAGDGHARLVLDLGESGQYYLIDRRRGGGASGWGGRLRRWLGRG